MRKLFENKYLNIFCLAVLLVFGIVLTVDIIKVILVPERYNFNIMDTSYSRRSLSNYLSSLIPMIIITYFCIYFGFISLQDRNKKVLRIIFNAIVLILILLFIIGIYLWAVSGFDH
jgi:peptidoglycan biosynthesis protein MviN/MurJ (putative lipid II flippase)